LKKILFRVDASVEIGYGHLTRCICLALFAKEQAVDCLFVLRKSDQSVQQLLNEKGLAYKLITREADLHEMKKDEELLVVDIHNPVLFEETCTYKNFLLSLKENGFQTVLFEDFVKDVFPAKLVIIPYLNADILGHTNTSETRFLSGPDYFVFREEFVRSPKVLISETVKNIFICMGGTDPGKLTEKMISLLIDHPNRFHLHIVFARLSDERKQNIISLLKSYKGSYEIFVDPPFISTVMLKSDLGIINSGLIKYETCVMGLPCISVSNNTFHENLMQFFAEKNLLVHLGVASEITRGAFHSGIDSMVENKEQRSLISRNSIRLFDGKGVQRIFKEMQNLKN
jgi:UDP-2,4-diacetamido-2,4,6-trideoxy-beta-L-altropyranose hydrolase